MVNIDSKLVCVGEEEGGWCELNAMYANKKTFLVFLRPSLVEASYVLRPSDIEEGIYSCHISALEDHSCSPGNTDAKSIYTEPVSHHRFTAPSIGSMMAQRF